MQQMQGWCQQAVLFLLKSTNQKDFLRAYPSDSLAPSGDSNLKSASEDLKIETNSEPTAKQ